MGEDEAAIALLTQMIAVCVQGRYGIPEMVGCNTMGEILEAREELEKSRAFLERAYQLRQDLGASRMGHVHGNLPSSMLAVARVAAKQGDSATASAVLTDALPLAQAMRDGSITSQIEELMRRLEAVKTPAR